jgi:hypothetical protein
VLDFPNPLLWELIKPVTNDVKRRSRLKEMGFHSSLGNTDIQVHRDGFCGSQAQVIGPAVSRREPFCYLGTADRKTRSTSLRVSSDKTRIRSTPELRRESDVVQHGCNE